MPALFGRSYFGRSKYGRGAWGRGGGIMPRLVGMGGLTFFKDFRSGSTPAEYAAGTPGGMYTCSRSATNPSTWIDANGVIQVSTTSDVPLFDYGYYDDTGFHAKNMGYHAFRSSTNLLTYTDGTAYADGLWTGWTVNEGSIKNPTPTNNLIPELTAVVGATSQRVVHSVSGVTSKTILIVSPATATSSVVQNDVVTFSIKIKSSSGIIGATSANIQFIELASNNSWTGTTAETSSFLSSISSSYRHFTFSYTAKNAACSKVKVALVIRGLDTGDTVDIEIALPQLEKLPYATPFIPTTTTALTRNAGVLRFNALNNLPTDDATIIVAVTPFSDFSNDGNYRYAFLSGFRPGICRFISGQLLFLASESSYVLQSATIAANTKYVLGLVKSHSSPYVSGYKDGVLLGTNTTTDYASNSSSYFYIGSDLSPTIFDGNIESVAIYNRALTAEEVSYVSSIL